MDFNSQIFSFSPFIGVLIAAYVQIFSLRKLNLKVICPPRNCRNKEV